MQGRTQDQLKSDRGALNYQSGLAAEDIVRRHYQGRGAVMLEQRWRGRAGEVDLIFRMSGTLVFVEVKAAASFRSAAERLTNAQIGRVALAAEEYTSSRAPKADIRIDAALVDCRGCIDIIENITLA